MTVDDLVRLPADGWQYELVYGTLVRMPLSGGEASRIGMRLGGRLMVYVEDHDLGAVTGEAGGFDLSTLGFPDTELAPDVAFTRAAHVPARGTPAYAKAWPVAPDLAVEVASPNQHRPGMAAKARIYLAAGARLVWVIWPRRQQVDVWRPGATAPSRLGLGDLLDGETVVPGFSYLIDDLFK